MHKKVYQIWNKEKTTDDNYESRINHLNHS